jgi:hypothetical protein
MEGPFEQLSIAQLPEIEKVFGSYTVRSKVVRKVYQPIGNPFVISLGEIHCDESPD